MWFCHTRIRTALDRAVQDGLIRTNPAADRKLPFQNAKEMQLLSREETRRFLIQAKEGPPLGPATVRKRLQTILKHAGCGKVRFHDLRHLFVTAALENGMDAKTLSTIIGHVSAKTTLNVCAHVTDEIRQTAAVKIDRGIGKCKPPDGHGEGLPVSKPSALPTAPFVPYRGKIREPGMGCATRVNDHLWEGRYSPRWPAGKIHARNVYASTEAECEEKLAELIRKMKAEIVEANRLLSDGKWEKATALTG